MEQIKMAMEKLIEVVKNRQPESEFNVDIKCVVDTNKDGMGWVIQGRIDTKDNWNDFFASGEDFEKVLQTALIEVDASCHELTVGIA